MFSRNTLPLALVLTTAVIVVARRTQLLVRLGRGTTVRTVRGGR